MLGMSGGSTLFICRHRWEEDKRCLLSLSKLHSQGFSSRMEQGFERQQALGLLLTPNTLKIPVIPGGVL